MEVPVTGASGRLACYVVRQLAQAHDIVLTSRRQAPMDAGICTAPQRPRGFLGRYGQYRGSGRHPGCAIPGDSRHRTA